jgi:hypothetical protein
VARVSVLLEIVWRHPVTLGTYSGRGHLRRIDGRTLADHLAAIKRYWNAVADLV